MTLVTTTYQGIEITYSEQNDTWGFVLRGRERNALSLAKAKEAIDKPVPAEKGKTFERRAVIKLSSYSIEAEFGEVTSIADQTGYRGSPYLWFVGAKSGRRSKEPANMMYLDTAENRAIMATAEGINEEANKLHKKAQETCQTMAKLSVEVPE